MQPSATKPEGSPESLDLLSLVKETATSTVHLAEKQVELLRAELTAALHQERERLTLMALGGGVVVSSGTLLIMAGVLALAGVLGHPAWIALIAAVVLGGVGGGMVAMGVRRHRRLLAASRVELKEEVAWAEQKASELKSSI